ncbi:MAG: bifunctional UDP-N-acetylglucosamine diphosphorylase/glucosamine-1-phosphate N-acetyltransferase GlmU [Synechococcaceae bacterium WB4_2_0805]|nr:bifunctional UDP-N-acetylglucosamine diphosphorylase/glucosamine-1-phosphate N-acetyltransferase GlmU [Synechococcaceae bacterium WB4_2_0805]
MLAVAVLAAGKGTRMKSSLPKVLQPLAGATLLERVIKNSSCLNPDRLLLIVGHQAERVQQQLQNHPGKPEFILQQPQNGTGHAIQQLIAPLAEFDGNLLVLNGDVPLLKQETLAQLLDMHCQSGAEATLLTAMLENPNGYGRVFSNNDGEVTAIVEDRDCDCEQRQNKLINAGIYCFKWSALKKVLPTLSSENDQGELYLTDTIAMLNNAKHLIVSDISEITGINDRQQLADCEAMLQDRIRQHWLKEGVSFIDPKSCTISEETQFGRDVVVEPQCHFRGNCKIGNFCRIGPGSLIIDAEIGNDATVLMSVINSAKIGDGCNIGPFAHLRPQADLGENVRIGNFVEVKKSTIGSGSKVNHLSYIGDAKLGLNVNVGAGTITANYDGKNKHLSTIGDNSKTGANSVLVAPVTIGSNVVIGAGSTITKDVQNNSLAIGRARQYNKENYQNLN